MVRLKETAERLTGGLHLSGLKFQTEKTERDGARGVRWSPAAIHGEAGGSEGTSVFPHRLVVVVVASEYHVEASFAPADGDSGGRGTRRRELRRTN